MSSIERTAYPRYPQKRTIDQNELHRSYTLTSEETTLVHKSSKMKQSRLSFAIQLKTFQRLGYFIELSDVPQEIIQHIRRSLNFHYRLSFGYQSKKTLYRHRKIIRDFLGVKRWGRDENNGRFVHSGMKLAIKFAYDTAQTMNNLADIINAVIDHLIQSNYELPSFYTLNRLVRHTRHTVNNRIFLNVHHKLLSNPKCNQLDDLLKCKDGIQRSLFNKLKDSPKRPTVSRFREFLEHFHWLESFEDVVSSLDDISKVKLDQFAEEANSFSVDEIKLISKPKRYTLMASLIYKSQANAKDALSVMLCRLVSIADKQARQELSNRLESAKEDTCKVVVFLKEIAENIQSSVNNKELTKKLNEQFYRQGGYDAVIDRCDDILLKHSGEHRIYLSEILLKRRSLLFKLLKALQLKSPTQDDKLIMAITFILKHETRRTDYIDGKVDLSFASQFWVNRIIKTIDGEPKLNRRELETCVFIYTKKHLSSGDLYIKGAKNYADYRDQLMPWEKCQQYLDEFCQEIGIANEPNKIFDELKSWLTKTADTVDKNYDKQSAFVINEEDGRPVLKKYESITKTDKAENIERLIRERLQEKSILDILCSAHHHTGWAFEFGPISGNETKLERAIEKYILTTFCYGTGMGPAQTAKHVRSDISQRILSRVNKKHTTVKALSKSIVRVVDYANGFPLVEAWGSGERCAADGTFSSIHDDNLISEQHIRYGKKGAMAYHHVSDRYLAFFSTFIQCGVWEAIYIIDGLLKNASELQPKIVHSDTQGQSLPVFALAHLLGIKLMPRIRNWKDLKFYKPSKDIQYENINSLFCDSEIDWDFLKTHWKDLMQVVISIKYGRVSSSFILSKLNSYNYKNKLYKAFQELGKVIRTQFLLEYISDKELRQTITATTNKVESYNGLSDWVRFASKFLVATNDPDEMEKSIKYNNLITNAIILQNIIDITDICHELKQEGHLITKEDIAGMSPYITDSIKRFGEYILDLNKKPPNVDKARGRAVF